MLLKEDSKIKKGVEKIEILLKEDSKVIKSESESESKF